MDLSILSNMVREKMHERNLSLRDTAKEIGSVSHSTVARLLEGREMDLDTLAEIAKWVNIPLDSIVRTNRPGEDEELARKLISIISANSRLKEVFSEVVNGISSGEVEIKLLFEIIAYAEFRIQYEKENSQD